MKYYIVDTRSIVGNCAMFWGINGNGYVCNLTEAGQYDEDEAFRTQASRGTDVALPVDVVEAMVVRHVRADTHEFHDAMKAARGRATPPPGERVRCGTCGKPLDTWTCAREGCTVAHALNCQTCAMAAPPTPQDGEP